jgi:hypothetical protein
MVVPLKIPNTEVLYSILAKIAVLLNTVTLKHAFCFEE